MTATETRRLGSVARFIRGISFRPDEVVPLGSGDAVACMRTKNVQLELDLADVWAVPRALVKRSEQFLAEGDLLVSSANSWNLVGKCCRVPDLDWPATFGGFISVLRADSPELDPRYLYHWFSSPAVQARVRSFGRQTTNISNLAYDRCLDLQLLTPPLAKQRRIAEILDKADALRAKRRGALAQLGALTQSVFLDMFGDPAANPRAYPFQPLIELIDPNRPITYGILMPGPDQANGVKYVRVVDMKEGGIDLSGIRSTTESISNEYRRSLLRTGDLLLSIRGHVGRTAVVPSQLHGANITQDTARLAMVGANPLFIRECLRTPGLQRWMARHTKGVAVRGINLTDVKAMPIPLPPRVKQDRFAQIAESVDQVQRSVRKHSRTLDALFASLQHRAFRGEL